jgi:hypothetical protein
MAINFRIVATRKLSFAATWMNSRLFVELTTRQLHQVHTKRGPTENSVHFPAAHLLGMRKDLSEHDEETQLC